MAEQALEPIQDAPQTSTPLPSVNLQVNAAPVSLPVGDQEEEKLNRLGASMGQFLRGTDALAEHEQGVFEAQQQEQGFKDQSLNPNTAPTFTKDQSAYYKMARLQLYGENAAADLGIQFRAAAEQLANDPEKLKNTDLNQFRQQFYQQHMARISDPIVAKAVYQHMNTVFYRTMPALAGAQQRALAQDTLNQVGALIQKKTYEDPYAMFAALKKDPSQFTRAGVTEEQVWQQFALGVKQKADTDFAWARHNLAPIDDSKPNAPHSQFLDQGSDGNSMLDYIRSKNQAAADLIGGTINSQYDRNRRAEDYEYSQNINHVMQDRDRAILHAQQTGEPPNMQDPVLQQDMQEYPQLFTDFEGQIKKAVHAGQVDSASTTALSNALAGGTLGVQDSTVQDATVKKFKAMGASLLAPNDNSPEARAAVVSKFMWMVKAHNVDPRLPLGFAQTMLGDLASQPVPSGANQAPAQAWTTGYDIYKALTSDKNMAPAAQDILGARNYTILKQLDTLMGSPIIDAGGHPVDLGPNFVSALNTLKTMIGPSSDERAAEFKKSQLSQLRNEVKGMALNTFLGFTTQSVDPRTGEMLDNYITNQAMQYARITGNGYPQIKQNVMDDLKDHFLWQDGRAYPKWQPDGNDVKADPLHLANYSAQQFPTDVSTVEYALSGILPMVSPNQSDPRIMPNPDNLKTSILEDGRGVPINIPGVAPGGVMNNADIAELAVWARSHNLDPGAPSQGPSAFEMALATDPGAPPPNARQSQQEADQAKLSQGEMVNILQGMKGTETDVHSKLLAAEGQTIGAQDNQQFLPRAVPTVKPVAGKLPNGSFSSFTPVPYPDISGKAAVRGARPAAPGGNPPPIPPFSAVSKGLKGTPTAALPKPIPPTV